MGSNVAPGSRSTGNLTPCLGENPQNGDVCR
jgi:hypothetical protein